MAKTLLFGVVLALTASVQGQRPQTRWGQCGGSGYDGPTRCPTEYYCTVGNPWYSQCVPQPGSPDEQLPDQPGVPDSPIQTTSFVTIITIAPTPDAPATVVTTYITFLTPKPSSTPVFTAPPQSTQTFIADDPITFSPLPRAKPRWITAAAKRAPEPSPAPQPAPAPAPAPAPEPEPMVAGDPTPSQLKQGQYWIRAVAAPHFHEYIQTNPQNEAAVAILGSHTTAGQYNIVDGQLVSAGSDDVLYMHVERPDDMTQRKLATWFNHTENDFGTFAFSGDALTWSTPEIQRQNLAAWLVCENNEMFINTGAYAYQTPAGCADQTIHYYNGATAND